MYMEYAETQDQAPEASGSGLPGRIRGAACDLGDAAKGAEHGPDQAIVSGSHARAAGPVFSARRNPYGAGHGSAAAGRADNKQSPQRAGSGQVPAGAPVEGRGRNDLHGRTGGTGPGVSDLSRVVGNRIGDQSFR